ncbi:DUF6702 family protein [Flavobacterium sp.]|uniref:DUF6702 family protein n=1 Tax=Flavobacterium sp. TaxID=239 RepID=UPI00286E3FD0|nr:DUF6702 family protein [Flavobacterium sp.]
MKKSILFCLLFLSIMSLSSFAVHKFYVSIYQINYVPEKKMLQITSRIFTDDLNAVLKKKFNVTTHIGETSESEEEVVLMKRYISENLSIKVNGKPQIINYLTKELEGNVVICYYNIKNVSKIKTIEIQNTALLEHNNEQQNIMQLNIFGKKQNLLFTVDNVKALLKP